MNEVRRLADEGRVEILVPCEVRAAAGNGRLEQITVENTETGELREVACDDVVTCSGSSRTWGRSPTGGSSSRTSARSA